MFKSHVHFVVKQTKIRTNSCPLSNFSIKITFYKKYIKKEKKCSTLHLYKEGVTEIY